jgi:hypothetical protein
MKQQLNNNLFHYKNLLTRARNQENKIIQNKDNPASYEKL